MAGGGTGPCSSPAPPASSEVISRGCCVTEAPTWWSSCATTCPQHRSRPGGGATSRRWRATRGTRSCSSASSASTPSAPCSTWPLRRRSKWPTAIRCRPLSPTSAARGHSSRRAGAHRASPRSSSPAATRRTAPNPICPTPRTCRCPPCIPMTCRRHAPTCSARALTPSSSCPSAWCAAATSSGRETSTGRGSSPAPCDRCSRANGLSSGPTARTRGTTCTWRTRRSPTCASPRP